jgi:hypothetical protein
MMNLNEPIIPGIALAGFKIGENINEAIEYIPDSYNVERLEHWTLIDDGLFTIAFDEKKLIYCISCDSRYDVRYQDKLWAGMSVRNVLERSTKQVAHVGFVVVDDIGGIGLPLPADSDDFQNISDVLSLDHVFNELSVFKTSGAPRARGRPRSPRRRHEDRLARYLSRRRRSVHVRHNVREWLTRCCTDDQIKRF